MTKVRRDQNILSLDSLLQQLRDIIRTTSISIDQQQDIILAVSEILQACTKTINIPLPGSDIQEVRGQNAVKRALEVAAAGGHNILLIGPKGSGKTVLARAFPSLLPKHTKPYPFRSPDASIDKEAFMGTPNPISPGELVLAHKGVLLMENLPAFELPLLVALRQAVEQHVVVLSEGERHIYFPAHFALVATMEPCPCGFYGVSQKKCKCSPEAITQYQRRIQTIIDVCFDIQIEVKYVKDDIFSTRPEENSASIHQRVETTREVQQRRFIDTYFRVNADLVLINEIQQYCLLDTLGENFLKTAQQRLRFSARSILRVQKVARTIADLAGSQFITIHHIAESIQYQVPLR